MGTAVPKISGLSVTAPPAVDDTLNQSYTSVQDPSFSVHTMPGPLEKYRYYTIWLQLSWIAGWQLVEVPGGHGDNDVDFRMY
jgi:hypothetical protein